MKKIPFFALAALTLGLAACSSDEVVNAPANERTPISFAPFVDYSTQSRAATNDLNNTTLTEFAVYGFHYPTSNISGTPNYDFSGDKVTGSYDSGNSASWSYTTPQYWQTGNTYWFSALAPYGGAYTVEFNATPSSTYDGIIKITNFDNSSTGAAGKQDLIYAKPTSDGHAVTGTSDALTVSNVSDKLNSETVGRVQFTFNHLLSRIRVELANGDNNTSVLSISDLKITDAILSNSIDLTAATPSWATSTTTGDLAYGSYFVPGITDGVATVAYSGWQNKDVNEAWDSDDANTLEVVRYIIPGQHKITLSFTASFYYKSKTNAASTGKYTNDEGNNITKTFTAEAAVSTNLSDLYSMGTAYVIKATITPQNIDSDLQVPIQFTVMPEGVKGWIDASNTEQEITTNPTESNSQSNP